MPKSFSAAQLEHQGRVKAAPKVSSGSPEELILRPNRKDVATISAAMALTKRGLSTLKATRAVEAMIANGDAVISEVFWLRRRAMRIRFERL